ncbi:MAG: PilZ domain-containing protein [Gemmatimonadetes bacterium]|nr:PilZ domain-containing protein [Gemmatimonadota bacterium]
MRANRFTMVLLKWVLLAATLGWVAVAGADERADMWRMMGSSVRSDEQGDVLWFLVVALLLVVGIFLLARVYNRSTRPAKASKASHRPPARSFGEQAGALGFRPIEVSNLRRIARRLSGGTDPVSILATGSGRQFLTADLRKRIRRREKEIALLAGILQKLGARSDHEFHERSFVRVDAQIAIWLVQKTDEETAPDDDVIVDITPISGRLSDLSEGGAAICANVELSAGDVVEIWSADSQYWLPPTQSGVVSTRRTAAGELSISLHFLDPPVTEIRRVMQEIHRSERDDPEDLVGGPNGDNNTN